MHIECNFLLVNDHMCVGCMYMFGTILLFETWDDLGMVFFFLYNI